mgnify:CR=1 FL=1
MARIIKVKKERKVLCSHCLKTIGFTIDDVRSSYTRGLEYSEGWLDPDCVWNYITCPNCNKTISVDKAISDEEYIMLKRKYEES